MDKDCCWQSCLLYSCKALSGLRSTGTTMQPKDGSTARIQRDSPGGHWLTKLFTPQLQGSVWVTIHRYHHAAKGWQHSPHTESGSTARIQRDSPGGHWDYVPLFVHHEMITHLASKKYATPEMQMEPGTKVEGWPSPYLERYGRGYQCPTGCNTCDWCHLSPPLYLSVSLTLHSPSTLR